MWRLIPPIVLILCLAGCAPGTDRADENPYLVLYAFGPEGERIAGRMQNVTEEIHLGRAVTIIDERQRIKERTMKLRNKNYRMAIAKAQIVS